MTIVINSGLHTGCIGGIFITGIFGNFYTNWGEFLTFRTGIPGGLDSHGRAKKYSIFGQHSEIYYYITGFKCCPNIHRTFLPK